MRLGTAYVSIRAEKKLLEKGLVDAKKSVSASVNKMQSEISRLTFRTAQVSVAAFSAAMVLAAKQTVEFGREFERNMKTVQAWSGATGKDLKNLTNIAREMGANTEWSATQAAGALKYLAAAGFSANQSIAALPSTLNLATAGQVDLATATDITTDVLTAFGLGVSELNRVNDAFITTTSNSNTNVMMLGQSFKMVAPTAKLFGMSVEETAAMLGTLANSGVKAEMAGSGLNMVLLRTARAAKMLGMDAGTPLIDVLRKIKDEQWDATKIGEAFGNRQVKTAGILMDNISAYESLTKKINENKGSTEKLAKIIRDSLDNDLKILRSTIEEQMLQVFDYYKTDMRDMAQATTQWAKSIGADTINLINKFIESLNKIKNFASGFEGSSVVTEIGLVGWVLLGKQYGKVIFALSAINDGMRIFGLNIGSLVDKGKEFSEVWKNIEDVLKGQRDWNTGLPIKQTPAESPALDEFNSPFMTSIPGQDQTMPGQDQTDRDAAQQEQLEKSLEIDQEAKERYLELELSHQNAIIDFTRQRLEAVNKMSKAYANNEIAMEVAKQKQKQRLDKQALKNAQSFFLTMMNLSQGHHRGIFEVAKAASIANAIVSTYTGAANALRDVPFPYNLVAAAAVIATGMQQVQQIRAQSFDGGGGAGGGITGAGTYASPIVTTPVSDESLIADTETSGGKKATTYNIYIDQMIGDEQYIDSLVERINDAEDRDVYINKSVYARELE